MTRYYDISGRVQVFHCGFDGAVSGAGGAITLKASSGTVTTPQIDRTGYWSYMLHVAVLAPTGMTAGEYYEITGMKMQALNDDPTDAAYATWQDITSVTTTDVNYKPIYLNRTGVVSGSSNVTSNTVPVPGVAGSPLSGMTTATATDAQIDAIIPQKGGYKGGCFVPQPYRWTALGTTAAAVLIDARIFGSFRVFDSPSGTNYGTVGHLVSPSVTITPSASAGHVFSVYCDLLLGAGDEMPVIQDANPQTGWGGTGAFYSQGQ